MAVALLQTRDLGRRYGEHWAVAAVGLGVAPGEVVALLGPNGAGKSTLLRVLSTLERADRGEIEFEGHPLPAARAALRGSLGYVGHEGLLDEALTARENLLYSAALLGLDDAPARADARLGAVGLAGRAHSPVGEFSRGMRQRLSLARARLASPRLLLLDEPGSGLDAAGLRWLATQLAEERERGTAVLVATHQLEALLPACDRVVLLRRGRVIHEGPRDEHDPGGWAAVVAEAGG